MYFFQVYFRVLQLPHRLLPKSKACLELREFKSLRDATFASSACWELCALRRELKGKLNRELSTACRTMLLLIAKEMSILTSMSEANFLRSVGAQAFPSPAKRGNRRGCKDY